MPATILDLPERIAALPDALRAACQRIFAVSVATGHMRLPEAMHAWTRRQFGSLAVVERQTVVKVVNRLTLEGALFNPARARRPAMGHTDDAAIEAWVAEELHDDVFARPLEGTPNDVFGRIRGEFCITASNIAKYDGWHAVVICDEPHPLRFTRKQVVDYVDVAWRWIQAAHALDHHAIYPLITWNCLPKSGASLAHGHLQVALGRDLPYTRVETWRRAIASYGANYLADMDAIHAALGLALPELAGVRRFVHLTPARNREVVLVGGTPHALAEALYETLNMLIGGHGVRAFNAAIAFPPLAPDGLDWRGVTPFARVGDRGNPLSVRSDVGVMELYGMGVITADPFELVAAGADS